MTAPKKKYSSLIIGILIMVVFISMVVFPQIFTSYSTTEMFLPWQKITTTHLLGTNDIGNDIFSQLIYGARNTLYIGIISAALSVSFGVVIGVISGYSGGVIGEITGVFINAFLIIPTLPLAIVVIALWGGSTYNMIITIAILSFSGVARTVRGKTTVLKQEGFVESLLILGIPHYRIVLKHIIPNLRQIISVSFISRVSSAMLTEATLSFLGFGMSEKITWGGMMNLAYKLGGFSRGAVNWFLPGGVCISLCVLALHMINSYIEKQFDEVKDIKE